MDVKIDFSFLKFFNILKGVHKAEAEDNYTTAWLKKEADARAEKGGGSSSSPVSGDQRGQEGKKGGQKATVASGASEIGRSRTSGLSLPASAGSSTSSRTSCRRAL